MLIVYSAFSNCNILKINEKKAIYFSFQTLLCLLKDVKKT